MHVNETFARLEQSYLFSTVARKTNAYRAAHPDARVIRLSIGDVTQPLAPAVVKALQDAVAEMGRAETFRGYCDDAEGYEFLRKAVADHYARLGATIGVDEVFVSDGAKSDLGNFLDVVAPGATVLIPDPVYPAYVDTNVMADNEVVYVHGSAEDGFLPLPDPSVDADLVYICSPNNPTGAVYTSEGLAAWVDYALAHDALIIFDSAYEAFIRSEGVPHTIYEIDGAERCAVEISSFSKRAGFTGVRCGFTVVPKTLSVADGEPERACGAAARTQSSTACPTSCSGRPRRPWARPGKRECGRPGRRLSGKRPHHRRRPWTRSAYPLYGRRRTRPYIWMECPGGMRSWDFFDLLLEKAQVVAPPASASARRERGMCA